MRIYASALCGVAIAGLLFLFMPLLIQTAESKPVVNRPGFEFVRVITRIPEPPEPPKPADREEIQKDKRPVQRPELTPLPVSSEQAPDLTSTLKIKPQSDGFVRTDGTTQNSFGANIYGVRNGGAEQILLIEPMWPRIALQKGIEGVVEVEFTIESDGSVSDVIVLAAQPRGIFDRATKEAVYRWKFRPRMVDGLPNRQRARQIVRWKLDNQ